MSAASIVSYSIVSHGQGRLVRSLLEDMRSLRDEPHEILLTLNIPEDESFLRSFADLPIRLIRNTVRKGFGANHNAAFRIAQGDPFVIVNPDIRLAGFSMPALLDVLGADNVGAVAPVVLSSGGTLEDSVRRAPSVGRLLARIVLRRRQPDYRWDNEPIQVDWAAGMFVAYRRAAFLQVQGFDERFFMYFEDADIGRRLARHGWLTLLQPRSEVIHDAQRASRRSLRHLRWQVASCLRYLAGV